MYTIEYCTNNSGGYWWLKEEDWKRLEESGWTLTPKDDIFDVYRYATITTDNFIKAIDSWQQAVKSCAIYDEGCPCCGEPHIFYVTDPLGKTHYLYGSELFQSALEIVRHVAVSS